MRTLTFSPETWTENEVDGHAQNLGQAVADEGVVSVKVNWEGGLILTGRVMWRDRCLIVDLDGTDHMDPMTAVIGAARPCPAVNRGTGWEAVMGHPGEPPFLCALEGEALWYLCRFWLLKVRSIMLGVDAEMSNPMN
jgi:hypothetical protein